MIWGFTQLSGLISGIARSAKGTWFSPRNLNDCGRNDKYIITPKVKAHPRWAIDALMVLERFYLLCKYIRWCLIKPNTF